MTVHQNIPASIDMDISTVEFDRNGIIDFYWPYDKTRMITVRDAVVQSMVPLLRRRSVEGDKIIIGLGILFKWFMINVIRYYESSVLYNDFIENGIKVKVPPRFSILSAFLRGEQPSDSLLSELRRFPGRRRIIPLQLFKLLASLKINNFSPRVLFSPGSGDHAILIQPNDLALKHASETDDLILYDHLENWFTQGPDPAIENAALPEPENRIVEEVVTIIGQAMQSGGAELSEPGQQYFRDWISSRCNMVGYYLSFLRQKPLPAKLLIGSAGASVFGRIFGHAVQANGGRVIAHDHGHGNAYCEQFANHITEFDCCDEFFTYNRINADIKKDKISPDLLINGTGAIFSWPKEPAAGLSVSEIDKRATEIVCNRPIKKIMFVPTAFHGERARLRPIPSDLAAFDFQVRLLSFFQDQGIQVIYKPHPEGASHVPAGFSEYFGYKTILDRFEKVHEEVDAYLVDFICSSSTFKVLQSKVPVIFIDMENPALYPEAKELLQERCYILESFTRANNRININWERLQEIIRKDTHKFNTRFMDCFYSNV